MTDSTDTSDNQRMVWKNAVLISSLEACSALQNPPW